MVSAWSEIPSTMAARRRLEREREGERVLIAAFERGGGHLADQLAQRLQRRDRAIEPDAATANPTRREPAAGPLDHLAHDLGRVEVRDSAHHRPRVDAAWLAFAIGHDDGVSADDVDVDTEHLGLVRADRRRAQLEASAGLGRRTEHEDAAPRGRDDRRVLHGHATKIDRANGIAHVCNATQGI